MSRRTVLSLVAVVAVAIFLAPVTAAGAQGPAPHASKKVSVDLFGDSLSAQAANYLAGDLDPFGAVLHAFTFGGTALCDWVYPHMSTSGSTIVPNSRPGAVMDLTSADAPEIAILQFVGNRTTSCIATSPFNLVGFLANYRYCLEAAIAHLRAIGTRHIIVDAGPPSSTVIVGQSQLRAQDKAMVQEYHDRNITYATTADASVLDDGQFAWNLPCLGVEVTTDRCTGPVVDDVEDNVVRSSDGVHFCPDTRGVNGLIPFYCPVYSSGAYRFALAFAKLVWTLASASEPRDVPVISSVAPDVGPASGGTSLTVAGYNLASIRTVQFVELFVPLINGVEVQGGTPVTVVVSAPAPTNLSANSLTVTTPMISTTTSHGDVVNVFVRVISAHAESTIGLTSDAFYPTTTSSS